MVQSEGKPMRRWGYALLAFVALCGCEGVPNQSALLPLSCPGKLADPEAVRRCLPPLVDLDTLVTPPSGARPFRVGPRLAAMGAQVREEGTLTDLAGRVIYVKPRSFPHNSLGVVMEETKRFFTSIMTPAEIAGSTGQEIKFSTEMTVGE